MATQLYKLELVPSYPNDTHHRAGLLLSKGGTLVTELSKDQLEAVKNDSSITLSKAAEGDESKTPGISDQGAGVADIAAVGPDAPDRSASEEDEAADDQGEDSEEEAAGDDAGAEGEEVAGDDAAGEGSDDAAGDTAGEGEDEAAEGEESAEGSENAAGEGSEAPAATAEDLARDNDRPTLNKLALEAGVVEPEKLQNKLEVATALLEKRG